MGTTEKDKIKGKDQPADADQTEPEAPKMLEFEHGDHTWKVPADTRTWDFLALEALEAGKAIAFLRAVLGTAQFATFQLSEHRTAGDARQMMDKIMTAVGESFAGE